MAKKSNNARSLEWLRNHGWFAAVCEQWKPAPNLPGGGFRRDLFGFADILAFRDLSGITRFIQVTSEQQITGHLKDYRRNMEIRIALTAWIDCCGNEFHIHGWFQRQDGKRKIWSHKVVRVTTKLLQPTKQDLKALAEKV